MRFTHESFDAAVDPQQASRDTETRQQTDDLGRETLNLLVGVLQQVDEAHDAAELLQSDAHSLAGAHLAQDLQRSHLTAAAASHYHGRPPVLGLEQFTLFRC